MKLNTNFVMQELISLRKESDIDAFMAHWNLDTSHLKSIRTKIDHVIIWMQSVDIKPHNIEDCRLSAYYYSCVPNNNSKKTKFRTIRDPVFLSVSEQVWHKTYGYPQPQPFVDRENASMRVLFRNSQLSYFQLAMDHLGVNDVKLVPEALNGRDAAKIYTPLMKRVLSTLVNAGDSIRGVKYAMDSFGIGWTETRKTLDLGNLREIKLYQNVVPEYKFTADTFKNLYSLDIITTIEKMSDKELLRALDHYGSDSADDRLVSPSLVQQFLESIGLISKAPVARSARRSIIVRDLLVVMNKKDLLIS